MEIVIRVQIKDVQMPVIHQLVFVQIVHQENICQDHHVPPVQLQSQTANCVQLQRRVLNVKMDIIQMESFVHFVMS